MGIFARHSVSSAGPSYGATGKTIRRPRPTPERWAGAGVEPTVEELMADPMTALIMRRDRIGPASVWAVVEEARARLRGDLAKAPESTAIEPGMPPLPAALVRDAALPRAPSQAGAAAPRVSVAAA